ncbi:hypothetical protein BV898_13917 [Hypsibius exemplaris]|uniref:Uncharacterized protein n=1 Tax=Hypsibius exemplaris TaxID=2072580 RepID=A0A1W0W9G6_HYPEX|nr:hypothetical protein BV898_13917 [Hypsibius exemplaris]
MMMMHKNFAVSILAIVSYLHTAAPLSGSAFQHLTDHLSRPSQQMPSVVLSSRPPGELVCKGHQAIYSVSDQDLRGHLLSGDPAAPLEATVEHVHMGVTGASECHARRNHHGKHVVTAAYSRCGFVSVFDRFTERIVHSNEVEIVIQLTAGASTYRRKVHLPVSCHARTSASVQIDTTQFELEYLEALTEEINLPISLGIRKAHRALAFGESNVFINILTLELEDPHHHSSYDIIGRRVFVTPTRNPDIGQTELVSDRGCNAFPEFLSIRKVGSHKIIYETLDFGLDGHRDYVFHVEATACSTVVPGDRSRCTQLCLNDDNSTVTDPEYDYITTTSRSLPSHAASKRRARPQIMARNILP